MLIARHCKVGMVSMSEETRYWPRLGMRVTKNTALEAAERMSGQASFYDDDAEEFVQKDNEPKDAKREVERLFDAEDANDKQVDDASIVILKSIELHRKRKSKLIGYRKQAKKLKYDLMENPTKKEFLDTRRAEYGDEEVDEAKIAEHLVVELKRQRDSWVSLQYQEWFDEKVVALQKEHGVYVEPFKIDEEE